MKPSVSIEVERYLSVFKLRYGRFPSSSSPVSRTESLETQCFKASFLSDAYDFCPRNDGDSADDFRRGIVAQNRSDMIVDDASVIVFRTSIASGL